MLELHTSELVVDSLYDYFSSLVEFLSAGLLPCFAALFDKLHQLFFFQCAREFALRINLIIRLFPMWLLVSLKDMFNNLISGTSSSLVPSYSGWLELLLLFHIIYDNTWLVRLIFCWILGWFMLLQNLRVQKLERDQRIINEGLKNGKKRFLACTHYTHCVFACCAEVAFYSRDFHSLD